jgi:hypothetical protein
MVTLALLTLDALVAATAIGGGIGSSRASSATASHPPI